MSERIVFGLNKLVRGKLPGMMREMGQEPEVTTLSGDDLVRALIAKVAEEVAELDPESPTFKEELSDVVQIVKDLVGEVGVDEVEQIRLQKLEKKGGFDGGLFIARLGLEPDDGWVEYYRQEPDKYPEETA